MLTGRVYIVRSGSMAPALGVGDVVIVQPLERMPDIGDIITYEKQGQIITHRVVKIEDAANIMVKGDANQGPDPWRVQLSEVRGKVTLHIPYLGYFFAFVRQPSGWFLLVILPVAFILYNQAKETWGLYREWRREKENLAGPSDS